MNTQFDPMIQCPYCGEHNNEIACCNYPCGTYIEEGKIYQSDYCKAEENKGK